MKEYLESTNTELIVAAVECNHSPDNGRLREYSPFDFNDPEFGFFQGLGDITMSSDESRIADFCSSVNINLNF